MENGYEFTMEEWEICLRVLEKLKDDPLNNPANQHFASLITKIHKKAKQQLRKESYPARKAEDIELIKNAELAKNALQNTTNYSNSLEEKEATYTPLNIPRNCYCCNQSYDQAHSFYHKLCPTCAEENYRNRRLPIDLSGRQVILTGGRVKIGYASALKFLRNQANLVVTTRFPALALANFQQEEDYDTWKDRLEIYGLDLRNLQAVKDFINYYQANYDRLDVLVNNAAQTIKYPDEYYIPMIIKEKNAMLSYNGQSKLRANSTMVLERVNALEIKTPVPTTLPNRFGQPVDLRAKNSWNSKLEEISTFELLEVNLINHIAPYLLIKGLLSMFEKSSHSKRFIINVTSSEGQFSYSNKTIFHPHTNMTKAALNMLTRTTAVDYAKKQIYMNSVDVGWVSTGAHEALRKKQFEQGFIPPLDSVDGAARILHPIFATLNNKSIFVGKLLKNYKVVDW